MKLTFDPSHTALCTGNLQGGRYVLQLFLICKCFKLYSLSMNLSFNNKNMNTYSFFSAMLLYTKAHNTKEGNEFLLKKYESSCSVTQCE